MSTQFWYASSFDLAASQSVGFLVGAVGSITSIEIKGDYVIPGVAGWSSWLFYITPTGLNIKLASLRIFGTGGAGALVPIEGQMVSRSWGAPGLTIPPNNGGLTFWPYPSNSTQGGFTLNVTGATP